MPCKVGKAYNTCSSPGCQLCDDGKGQGIFIDNGRMHSRCQIVLDGAYQVVAGT